VLALLGGATVGRPPDDDLVAEIEAVLCDRIPRTAPEVAKAVGRRRSVVENALADARFVRVSAPPGRSRRAFTWGMALRAWDESGRVGTSGSERRRDRPPF
jgi:hypothetical protein